MEKFTLSSKVLTVNPIGNGVGWFKDKDGKATILPVKQLLRDIKTRWDSTFQMLKNFIDMRPVSVDISFIVYFLIISFTRPLTVF